jgi:hypothetical protein
MMILMKLKSCQQQEIFFIRKNLQVIMITELLSLGGHILSAREQEEVVLVVVLPAAATALP